MRGISAMIEDRRQSERQQDRRELQYSTYILESTGMRSLALKGFVVDSNNSGIGMRTNYNLESGHVVRFRSGTDRKAGIVKWSNREEGVYRVGIKFV
jgi:hypothetical protein